MSDPYPFESDDDIEIRELALEDVDEFGPERISVGELAGEYESWHYGHVIVDEAQELTPMQWRMVMRRVRGRSLTIVGDLAQRSERGATDWADVLPAELQGTQRRDLTVNYRSPVEVHELAVKVLSQFAPSVAPSRALRRSGFEPAFVEVDDLVAGASEVVQDALLAVGGQVAVISTVPELESGRLAEIAQDEARVRFLSPDGAKGLEFDAVVLVEPASFADEMAGPAWLYIAVTRATQRLYVVHHAPLPAVLRGD